MRVHRLPCLLGTAVQDAHDVQHWLTIAEAAAALGTSPDTVRRKIRRGELTAQRRARQVRVRLDGVHGSVQGTAVQMHSTNDQVAELVATPRAQLEVKDQQISNLMTLLAQAQRALPSAPAPVRQEASNAAPGANLSDPGQNAAMQPSAPRRPWWRFWAH